ncbi:hypothetical protein LTS18_013641 [Coniosporium uncinatum]|uniref:Uncharacterized protein n=1 Tax=Coniosporium uncinatum TaxID=93489 RepID=A0ACC3DVL4_9PEZI|nr:hypothetical protein LTS18_013641 [Coniosporium uncinatum]
MAKTLGEARANGETGTGSEKKEKDKKHTSPKVVHEPISATVPRPTAPAYTYHYPTSLNSHIDAPQPFDNTPQVRTYQPRLDSQHYAGYAGRYYPQAPAYVPIQYTYPPQTYDVSYGIYPYPGTNQQYTYAAQPQGNYVSKPPPPPEPVYYQYPNTQNNTAYAYPATAYPTTYPTAYAAQPAYAYATPHDTTKTHGRTRAEVLQDNEHIAATTGVDKPRDMAPKDPKPEELFRVYYPNGDMQLRNFATIEAVHYPGEWRKDPRDGSVCFVKEGMGVKAKE